jgi:hypothetical protein
MPSHYKPESWLPSPTIHEGCGDRPHNTCHENPGRTPKAHAITESDPAYGSELPSFEMTSSSSGVAVVH